MRKQEALKLEAGDHVQLTKYKPGKVLTVVRVIAVGTGGRYHLVETEEEGLVTYRMLEVK